jgi:ammonia channel protein AmtB
MTGSSGSLRMTGGTVLSRNAALGASGAGGGVHASSLAIVNLTDSFVSSNTAASAGGAHISHTMQTSLTRTNVTNNIAATGVGGGLYITSAMDTVKIGGSYITGRVAANKYL